MEDVKSMMLEARNNAMKGRNEKVVGKGNILNIFELKIGKGGNIYIKLKF